ncbi:MAG: ferrous iron transport protein B [Desulfurococcaceae archaeon]
MKRRLVVGLVGQPNVGKSTLFNTLTKGNAIVTNWPGTTVERNEAHIIHGDCEITIVDLPGIYGLSYLTLEEKISRRFIIEENPDLVIVLVDSLILERTLYLAIEIRELTGRVIIAVTKVDEAHSKGIHVNYEILEKRLGVPVIPVSAIKETGIKTLLDTVVKNAGKEAPVLRIDYGELESFIVSVESLLMQHLGSKVKYPFRWVAIKYLEGDVEVEEFLRRSLGTRYVELEEIRGEARRRIGIDIAAFTSMKRMNYIREHVIKNAVVKTSLIKRESRLNKLFYNPYVAPFISLGLIFTLFLLVFALNTGYPLTVLLEKIGYQDLALKIEEYTLSSLMEKFFEQVKENISKLLGSSSLSSFIVDGVLGGVASVVVFIPLIGLVMVILGALEDSGLLPRLAIGTHTLFLRLGLSGHSLLPITLSLGCNVPGVVSTRASPNYFERLKLILLTPFIPCQARLIVLLAIATALGGFAGSVLVPFVYLVAFSVFLALSYIIHVFFERKRSVEIELLLEVPPLHRPYLRVIWWFTWFQLKHFLIKAGTVIFLVSIISWGLQHLTIHGAYTDNVEESIIAVFSRSIAPFLNPIGVTGENAWIVAYAVILGFLAKELVISAIITTTRALSFEEAFRYIGLSTPSAVALSLFIALYIPCAPTIMAIYSETRSLKYALTSLVLMLTTAYLLAVFSYTIAMLLT